MNDSDEQRRYYSRLFHEHGHSPRAVDQRDHETQNERFFRLVQAFRFEPAHFSVHEIGCGLGDFGEYLKEHFPQADYSGSDICQEFVDVCKRRFSTDRFYLRNIVDSGTDERYDFVTISGTFNTRLSADEASWSQFVRRMMRAMYSMCNYGIVVNFLTSYCDQHLMRGDLHYQDEKEILDFVISGMTRHIELDASGPLYEYTLRIYRPDYIRARYPEQQFSRYFRSD